MIQNVDFTRAISPLWGEYIIAVLYSHIAVVALDKFTSCRCISADRLNELMDEGKTSLILNDEEIDRLVYASENVIWINNYV